MHHRVDRRLSNMNMKRDAMGTRIYPPLDAEMKVVGLEEVDMYVL